MDDKKYTYDIGKYTIGVDTNGEDGIGLTIAIIKNGEINFLGNCYGENARCIDLLIKENQELKNIINQIGFEPDEIAFLQQENQELKKQLGKCYCNRTDCSSRIKDSKKYDSLVQAQEAQQKEFIKYLEDETKRINPKILDDGELNLRLDDIKYTQYLTYKEILRKYRSIIGCDKVE